ncbi:MAG: hypothetical protein IT256_00290 [Chitinophagaceae bacterium]|nr:hypothetical protein [Chitinophagaceae bacterium]
MTDFLKKLTKTDTRSILAIIATLGVFSFVGLLFIVAVPQENVALLNTLLPMLISGIMGMAFGFYFGSSKKDGDNNEKESVK